MKPILQKKKLFKILFVLIASAVTILFYLRLDLVMSLYQRDPDSYYHYAVSRMMSETGILKTLPQAEDIGWGHVFREKEFLFHALTTIGWKINQEEGVRKTKDLIACASLLLLFWFLSRYLVPWQAYIILFSLILSNSPFMNRLLMVRPQQLAIFFTVFLLLGFLNRNKAIVGIASLLFCLSYHAFYVPLILCVFYAFFHFKTYKGWANIIAYGVIGIIIGMILNPTFPGNIEMSIVHLRIALFQESMPVVDFGIELIPLASNIYLKIHLMSLAALFLIIAFLDKHKISDPSNFLFLTFYTGAMWAATALNPRGVEYAAPATAILITFVVAELSPRKRLLAVSSILLLSLIHVKGTIELLKTSAPENKNLISIFKALEAIPHTEEKFEKVYNCNWDVSPYILYKRPDLRFVDILDPSFLYYQSSEVYQLRQSLNNAAVDDPYLMLKRVFRADYVLCTGNALIEQLRNDPRFNTLYRFSPEYSRSLTVFALSEDKFNLLKQYSAAFPTATYDKKDYNKVRADKNLTVTPVTLTEMFAEETSEKEFSPYLNLDRIAKKRTGLDRKSFSGKAHCTQLQPAAGALKENAGATYLGIGGGRNIRVWRNNIPIYSSAIIFDRIKLINELIPLSPPLNANDKIDVIVCSSSEADYWGFAMSFWTEKQIYDTCKAKNEMDEIEEAKSLKNVSYTSLSKNNCLAPIARTVKMF